MRRFALLPAAALLVGCKSTGSPSSTPAASSQAPLSSPSASSAPSSASTPTSASVPPAAPVSPEKLKEAAHGDGNFAASLYRLSKETSGNRLISPLSIRIAFAMAYAGARSETQTEMHKALGLRGDASAVHEAFGNLLADWNSRGVAKTSEKMPEWEREHQQRKLVVLRVVNRLWGQAGRAFEGTFKTVLRDKYGAPLEELDFKKDLEGSRGKINAWVSDRTEKKIPTLIPQGMLDTEARLVLTNAVYFKAQWDEPFPEHATKVEEFFIDGTKPARTPMMHAGGRLGYLETKDASVLELPYSDGSLAMVFVLPKSKTGLAAIEASLKGEDFTSWTQGLLHKLVTYAIPRFKFEGGLPSLIDTMKAMGMARAFKFPEADFSGMDGTRELYIGTAIHKTFIAVDEKGTEAAAATALGMRAGSAAPQDPPKSFVADHPFLFFIHDRKSGAVLFVGRVTDPTSKG